MSYIGNEPITAAFLVDTFSGNGSTVAFTMSVAPANTSSILVAVTGVVQDPSTYSVSGTTLTFSAAPPSGTSNISVRYLGIPASGVTTTAYRTVTDTTATAGQTTFTIPSYTVGYVDVYRNGVRLAAADYTATTGTTVVLASAASAGDTITTESFYVSSVLNAIPQYNGTSVNQTLTTPTANTLTSGSGSNLQLQTNGGTTALTLDTSGNAGLGVTPSTWSLGKAFEFTGVGNAIWSPNAVNDLRLISNIYYNGGYKYAANGYANMYQVGGTNGTHSWYNAASGTAGNAITFTHGMTLDSSGSMFVGTSTTWLSSAAYKQGGLQVGNASYAAIVGQAGGIARYGIFYDAANTYLTVTSGGTFYVYNTANGVYLSANATSWTSNSDERLKDIIEPITNAASKVSSLRAVIGKYKSDADGTRRSFLIAQDVQAVLPEAVSESQSKDQEETYLGLQYTEVIPLLVAAIKEQQAIITQLQADVAALKGQA